MKFIFEKLLFYLRWGFYLLIANTVLKAEYLLYLLYKKISGDKTKRRIFLSSGNISLLNVLTIIKQLNEKDTEDYLVIDTVQGTKEFLDRNRDIAKLHNFKKVLCCSKRFALFEMVKHNIFYIDEIYAHSHRWYMKFIQPIFSKSQYYIFDEGMGSLVAPPNNNNKHICGLYVNEYCKKIDYLGWEGFKRVTLKTEIFNELSNLICQKYPFDVEIPKDSKTVIFCGSYWQQFKLPQEEYYRFESEIIKKLMDKGYTVIYKKHPREVAQFIVPEGALITNCLLPLDVYNLDIVGVISTSSSVSIHPYHYWKIPGFCTADERILADRKYNKIIDIIQSAIETYSLNVNVLFEINPKEMTKQEVLSYLQKKFQDNIDSQPIMSQNQKLKEEYQIYVDAVKVK